MCVNGVNVSLREGDCIFIFPLSEHNFIVDGTKKCQITQFEFSMEKEELLLNVFLGENNSKKYFKILNCSDILECIGNLYSYDKNKKNDEQYYNLFEIELQKLFILLSIHKSIASKIEEQHRVMPLKKILEYVDVHYDQEISFEQLSKEYGISSRYLRKIFKQEINFSPIEYVTMLRMEKAKDRLKNTSKTISKISVETGYNSLQYFSLIFKKTIGITPKEFRKQYHI